MTDYTDYEDFFSGPWCPVFGKIPGLGLPANDPLGEVSEIIDRARGHLGVMWNYAIIFDDNCPTIEEIESNNDDWVLGGRLVDPKSIKVIRDIYIKKRCIYQYVGWGRPGPDRYIISPFFIEGLGTSKMACSIKAPDDVILAALAIKEAYDIAYDIVMHNEEPNTARAWALLMAAENIVNKDEIKLLDEENIELVDEINSLLPKASIYDKQSSGFRDYNEGSAARKKEKEKIIWKWAVQIKRERLPEKIKSSQVINIIEKRIRNAEFPLDEIEDVRVKRTEKNPYGIPAMKNILIGFR